MRRVSKKPEERRAEILDTAGNLFFTKGYENTSVEKIIKTLNLAKGTFYYYFKSKVDVLEALAEKHAEAHYEVWEKIIQRTDIDALQKLNQVFQASSQLKAQNKELIISYIKAYMDEKNRLLRHKFTEHRLDKAQEKLGVIIHEGNRQDVFNTPYPNEAIVMIFRMGDSLAGEIFPLLLKMMENPQYKKEIIKNYEMLENFSERILGAKRGSIQFFKRGLLDDFIN
jgi:AcrR family transcriptional regulator